MSCREEEVISLLEYDELKGDSQVNTKSTDGLVTIEDIALAAKEKFELEYTAITDHTKSISTCSGSQRKTRAGSNKHNFRIGR